MQDSGYELPRIRLMRSSQNSAYANFGELRQSELRRIPIPRTSVNRGTGEPPSARVGTFRDVPSDAQHSYALFPDIIDV
jgi:hypothetical protein